MIKNNYFCFAYKNGSFEIHRAAKYPQPTANTTAVTTVGQANFCSCK
jgi:hypothetical protein